MKEKRERNPKLEAPSKFQEKKENLTYPPQKKMDVTVFSLCSDEEKTLKGKG